MMTVGSLNHSSRCRGNAFSIQRSRNRSRAGEWVSGAGGRATLLAIVLASQFGLALHGQVEPLGPQFQVNTYTTDNQGRAKPAVMPDGSILVIWDSEGSAGTDNDSWSIQARPFDSLGNPLSDDVQVNTYTTSAQIRADISARTDGTFVAVWSTAPNPRGQLLDGNGAPVGNEFVLPTGCCVPAVGSASDGSFVVVWQTGSPSDISGQRYDSDGNPVGATFLVNTIVGVDEFSPRIAVAPGGEFVVAWNSQASEGSDQDSGVQARVFASDGTPLASQFQVNTYTTGFQSWPRMAFGESGKFVVVWDSDGSFGTDTSGDSVQAQIFAADGTQLGGEFQVNATIAGSQREPDVALLPSGEFVVAWADAPIRGQVVNADGSLLGDEFQISAPTGSNYPPKISVASQGRFVVAWSGNFSEGDDTSGHSAQARWFRAPMIFADGFESGDTSAWSSTVP